MITITQSQRALAITETSVEAVLQELLKLYAVFSNEISIHFASKKVISELHYRYFNDPSPTDCITFPSDTPEIFLGEIIVCPSIAKSYAKRHYLDPFRETTLYLVHGFLHLIGYCDIEQKDQKKMWEQETFALSHLENKNTLLRNHVELK